jgi:menaquinone-specific isochorismate synthase
VLIVPRVVLGRRDGVTWITRVTAGAEPGAEATVPAPVPLGAEYRIALHPGELDGDGYRAAVAEAVRRIEAGEMRKVVVARDLVGRLPEGADLRRVLVDLALGYPDTWTFAVDGLLGSSPETLVRVKRGVVSARVLAGSVGRGADAAADRAAADGLAASRKDLDEHAFAVRSVLASLGPHAPELRSSERPFTLKLPNLWHLASDVEGALADGSTALDLVCELHPTAAVAGTPTDAALAAIRELEPFDRLRYGGAVGYVDGAGDGKWAVALRSAEVGGGAVRAFAGAGIVAGSDPRLELAETTLKFRPIVDAFG